MRATFSSRAPFFAALLLGALALFSGGCATPSKSVDMVATLPPEAKTPKHPQSVTVVVTGGSETSSAGASQISNTDFAEAIRQSIVMSGLFAKIAPGNDADYKVDVAIVRLAQPMFGFNMTVTLEANWTLTRRSDGKVLWQKAVIKEFTAKAGEAFAGVKRLRLANEGAARANIQEALTQIGAVPLQ